jgi:hypothetical protein
MNPISLVHLHKLLLPSPRSHWSATRPKSKTQPTATRHTQRKHTRHGYWQPKPVRPVSETGQTASVGLSLTKAGETGQTVWQTGQAGSVQKLPKDPSERKNCLKNLHKNSHNTTGTFSLKNSSRQPIGLNRSDRFGKPVRPILAWTVGKNSARGKNSNLQAIDLPNHSTDQSETSGIVGVPRGLHLARSSVPKTHSIKRNRKSTLKSTFPWRPPKTPKSKPFRRVC